MEHQTIYVNPSGDVTLFLDSRNKAVGHDSSAKLIKAHEVQDTTSMESTLKQQPAGSPELVPNSSDSEAGRTPDPSTTEEEHDPQQSIEVEEPECGVKDVSIRVSSGHLILASEVFKALLKGGFRESSELYAKGATEISLPDDSVDGLVVLMNIIHGKFRSLPKKMTPQLLIQIVLLVDKYNLHESVEPFTDRWMEQVRPKIPTNNWPEGTMSWISIALVLCLRDDFKHLTRLSLEKQVGTLPTNDLPVSLVADALAERKCKLLTKAFKDLEEVIELFWGRKGDRSHSSVCNICSAKETECHSMILGSILRSLSRIGFYPPPKEPYLLFEVGETIKKVEELQILSLCGRQSFEFRFGKSCAQTARSRILMITQYLRNGISGFEVEEFKSTNWR